MLISWTRGGEQWESSEPAESRWESKPRTTTKRKVGAAVWEGGLESQCCVVVIFWIQATRAPGGLICVGWMADACGRAVKLPGGLGVARLLGGSSRAANGRLEWMAGPAGAGPACVAPVGAVGRVRGVAQCNLAARASGNDSLSCCSGKRGAKHGWGAFVSKQKKRANGCETDLANRFLKVLLLPKQ